MGANAGSDSLDRDCRFFHPREVYVLRFIISTYKGLIAIRHVGGIPGREQEME